MSDDVVVGALIARGETGAVYAGEQSSLPVAVKVLYPHLAEDPVVRARFIREAQTLAQFDHPNIVRVYGVVDRDQRPAIVMERLDGGSLRDRRVSEDEALSLMRGLLEALALLHRAGIVHRDIRPGHIRFDGSGTPHLIDFGMASVRDLAGLTRSTVVTTRPYYVDPFGWGRGVPDPTSDLYSVGAVFYEALAGSPLPQGLFSGADESRRAALRAFASASNHFVRTLVPLLLEAPHRRPRSAGEALDWIESRAAEGARKLTECLFCGEPMPAEAAVCMACGREPLRVRRDTNGEFLALRRIAEEREILGPFLRRLQLLSASSDPLPPLLIGDSRLYSRAERNAGVRLPVRIAENISSASVATLVNALTAGKPDAVRIDSYPMRAARRVKRGPLITISEAPVVPVATADALRRLSAAPGSGQERARPGAPPIRDLRRECLDALAIAARRIGSGDASVIGTEAWRAFDDTSVRELAELMLRAVARLEATERYLATVQLSSAYADIERAQLGGEQDAGALESAHRVFVEYADAERRVATARSAIADACRALERIEPATVVQTVREVARRARQTLAAVEG